MRPRLIHILLVVVFSAAMGAAGGRVGGMWEMRTFGAVTGALLGLTLSIALASRQRPWYVIMLMVTALAGAHLLGGWGVVILGVALLALAHVTSALVLYDLYGMGRWRTFWLHLRMIAGLDYGFHVIRDGVTQGVREPSDKPLLGPRLVVVNPGSAAVMVKGGRQTRILGPGSVRSERFEFVRRSFDLQPRQKTVALSDVLTQDGLPLTITFALTYGLNVSAATQRGPDKGGKQCVLLPDEEKSLEGIVAAVPDWEKLTLVIAERAVRQVVRGQPLEMYLPHNADDNSATDPGPNMHSYPLTMQKGFATVEHFVESEAGRLLHGLGIKLYRAVVQDIQPPEQLLATHARAVLASDRAQEWSAMLQQIKQAYGLTPCDTPSDTMMVFELLRQLIEALAHDPTAQPFLSAELLHTLDGLRKTASGSRRVISIVSAGRWLRDTLSAIATA